MMSNRQINTLLNVDKKSLKFFLTMIEILRLELTGYTCNYNYTIITLAEYRIE